MANSSELEQFGIYLAKVYFEDVPDIYKVRPVLIIDAKGSLALVLKMTSSITQQRVPAYKLENWQQYGLNVPTTVLLSPMIALRGSDIYSERLLGILGDEDTCNVLDRLVELRNDQ